MRIFNSISSFLMAAATCAAAPAFAFDMYGAQVGGAPAPAPQADVSSLTAMPPMNISPSAGPSLMSAPSARGLAAPTVSDKTPDEAFTMARNLYRRGEKEEAVNVLQFAADQGHLGAQWMIGRMYARGEGVPADDLKAFEYFSDVVNAAMAADMDDSPEGRQNAAFISHAFSQLGSYYREGIPGTYVKPNAQLAIRLYSRAAFNYGDPNAQFNLGMMYVEGNGVKKDPKRAMQLFHNAAKKGHGPSRALLGDMMFKGSAGKRRPELGLMWMNLARQSAEQSGEADAQWMIDLHNKALAEASEDERRGASGFLDRLFK